MIENESATQTPVPSASERRCRSASVTKKLVSRKVVYDLLERSLTRAVQVLPPDIKQALHDAMGLETDSLAQLHIKTFLTNADVGEKKQTFVCPDTGWVFFYVHLGDQIEVEGGLSSLQTIAREVVSDMSFGGKLRPTMADPVTRKNVDSNVDAYFPKVEIIPDASVDTIEVTAVCKGGGSEIAGTFFRMLLPADGRNGICKFVIDSYLLLHILGNRSAAAFHDLPGDLVKDRPGHDQVLHLFPLSIK